jgi:hypothetical protein
MSSFNASSRVLKNKDAQAILKIEQSNGGKAGVAAGQLSFKDIAQYAMVTDVFYFQLFFLATDTDVRCCSLTDFVKEWRQMMRKWVTNAFVIFTYLKFSSIIIHLI